MRKGGGHAKGSAAEREVAVMLSRWWYGGKGYLWRRPGSEVRRYEKNAHSGDIVPTAEGTMQHNVEGHRWPFHVEVKSWKRGKLKIYSILDKPTMSPVHRVWKKAQRKKRKDLRTMLVLKENTHDWLVFMDRKTMRTYFKQHTLDSPFITFDDVVGVPWKRVSKFKKNVLVKHKMS